MGDFLLRVSSDQSSGIPTRPQRGQPRKGATYFPTKYRALSSPPRPFSAVRIDQSHLSLGEPPTLQIALQVKLLPCAKAGSSGPRGEELAQSPRWEAGPAPQSPGWSLAPTPSPTGEPEKWVGRARSTHSHQVSLNRMGQITPKRLPTLNFWKIQSEEPYGTG